MMGLLEEVGWRANSASDFAKVASAEERFHAKAQSSRKGAKKNSIFLFASLRELCAFA
jgi:hypothetical protein